MTWLIACEESGIVRDAFIRNGVPAISCDLEETDQPGPHIVGDVMGLRDYKWSGVIAHPPCTRLCLSGVRWLHERNLWDDMEDAVNFFASFYDFNTKYLAIENPVMHGHAGKYFGKPNFTCQPWQFGDNFKKRTCFWTMGLPDLVPTSDLDGSTATQEVWRMGPSKDRAKLRSRTYPGLADAMAKQWGKLS